MDLQENIYGKVEKIDYPSAGFAGRRIVDFKDLRIDIFEGRDPCYVHYISMSGLGGQNNQMYHDLESKAKYNLKY